MNERSSSPLILRLAIHCMVAVGGVAALSWESVWQLRSSIAFGVSAVGTALTLAATMAGMSVGAILMGRWLKRRTIHRPVLLYGLLELVIGLSGLLMPHGFDLLERLDVHFYRLSPALAPLLHGLGIALLIGPPTLAMGSTVPVFQLISRQHGNSVAVLYGVNTAGAACGVLLLSFVLLPTFGVGRSCMVMAALNLLIFGLALLFRRRTVEAGDAGAREKEVASGGAPVLGFGAAQLLVLLTGFVTFGLEVAWFRALRTAFWSTTDTFAIMLASVLVPLAVAARLVPLLRRLRVPLVSLLLLAGLAILLSAPLVERMDLFARTAEGGHYATLSWWLLLCLGILGPPILLVGLFLPWCLEEFRDPAQAGRLYGLNTLGSVLGALAAAWLTLPALGFARSSWLFGILVLLLCLLLCRWRGRLITAVCGAAALLVAINLSSSPGRDRYFAMRGFGGFQVLALLEGPDSTVTVVEKPDRSRHLMIDGFSASSTAVLGGQYRTWMGALPMLLHPEPKDCLVICFGVGQTAHALRLEEPRSLDIVDVSAAVFEMAGHFSRNHGILEDERVSHHVMDGRAWLRRTDRVYDIVTLEPMPPNFAGVNSLYCREFYEEAAARLAPGGIVAQWLPLHLVTDDHGAAITATFQAVYPDALLWLDPIGGTGILLGRTEAVGEPLGADWPGLRRRRADRTLRDGEIPLCVILGPEGLLRYSALGEVITDDNQLLAFGRLLAGFEREDGRRQQLRNHRIITRLAGRGTFALTRARKDEILERDGE